MTDTAGANSDTRRLVIVRAGPQSLHRHWLEGEAPRFDLLVNTYVKEAQGDLKTAYFTPGGKWEGLAAFLHENAYIFDRYDWIWLPDDDLDTDAQTINTMFDIAEAYGLGISQPSLTWDSYSSHFITLHNTRFLLRYTNFVELMAPLFGGRELKKILPMFSGRRFGWGLDWWWSRWIDRPAYRTGIIDAAKVRHTRPFGKSELYRDNENSPAKEMRDLELSYGMNKQRWVTYAGVGVHGTLHQRGPRLWYMLMRGWHPAVTSGYLKMSNWKFLRRVRRVCFSQFSLEPLAMKGPSE